MSESTGFLNAIDDQLGAVLQAWDLYTVVLGALILAFGAYTVLNQEEPDTHPMLLLRQSSAGMVRQPGESAIHRSHETPHGYPLRTGLQVKPKDAPAYSAGKDGDLRDVWRRASGELPLEQRAEPGKIMTVMGKEEVLEHDTKDISREMVAIGKSIVEHGGSRVAIYLPNCIEFLSTVFGTTTVR
ncbi:hypothetical protein LTS18_014237 [Coniosporium uncinatum]|uniref:Uncharacterized protein n=1 Tax=Coniosporium uncinatum TaxID=93489 RepID=A0ACC3CVJ5_9PEZI|nr:hypothetical protein LTS18_014237 [Coniosporium uncinatum]